MMIKKILKYFGLLIVGLVIALAIAPFVFKDKILAIVKSTLNDNLNATVDFSDADLSLLRSFPDATITIYDLHIEGIDTFYELPLIDASEVTIETNISPLFNKNVKPSIHFLKAKNAVINLLTLSDGNANYLITKPNPNDTSTYELKLNGYEIENGTLIYEDKALDFSLGMNGVNHRGSGNLSTDIFDLDTYTKFDTLTMTYAGIDYLDQIEGELQAKININLPEEKYTLKENKIRLNELDATGEGFVQFVPEGMKMFFDLKTPNEQFQDVVSVLPVIKFQKGMKASGKANLTAKVDGIYNSETVIYPAFDVQLGIVNGSFQYTGLPYPISNINADIKIKSTKSDLSDLLVNIPKFGLALNNEQLSGRLMVSNALGNGAVDGALIGDINLANWKAALPLDGVEKLSGNIKSNLQFKGKMSDIEGQNYDAIGFSGDFNARNIVYKTVGSPSISLENGTASASPSKLNIVTAGLNPGKSQLAFSGSLDNPLAVFSQKSSVQGSLSLSGNLLDLNEWQTSPTDKKSTETNTAGITNLDNLKASNIALNIDLDKVLFGDLVLQNLKTTSKVGFNHATISNFGVLHDGNDINLNGSIANVYDYLFNNGVLEGKLNLISKNFDANKYMAVDGKDTQTTGTILVPDNINVLVNAKLNKVKYTNLEFTNLSGDMNIANHEITMNGVKTDLLGGRVSFDGFYRTTSPEPEYSIKLDLAKLKMQEAYQKFVTMQALAPVSKFINGVFNTTLIMEGKLTTDMTPQFSSLNASGFIETISSVMSELKILDVLSDKLGLDNLKNINLDNTKNWFEIKQGYVELKEKIFEVKDIGIKISGKHQIQGQMDYVMVLKVPRTLLQKNKVTAAADKGWSWVESEAGKRGLNLNQGAFIDFRVDIGGFMKSPTIKITPIGSSGKSIQDEIKEEVQNEINNLVDSVKNVANEKKEQLKDTLMTRAEQEIEKAKDKLKDEVNTKTEEITDKAKEIITKEVETKLDSTLGPGVTDSLKKRAEQILKEKTGTEVDDIKKKLDDFNPFKKKKP